MNKKSEKQSGRPKKNYNTPQLSVHGVLSEITKGGAPSPNPTDTFGCEDPS